MGARDMIMAPTFARLPRRRKPLIRNSAILPALWLAAMLPTTAATAQLLLPPPGQNPQAIDFAADPLLIFLAPAEDAERFRAAIATAVRDHPSFGEAGAATSEASATRREVRSALFPALGASLVGSRSLARQFEGDSAIVEALSPRGRVDAVATADQLLFDFGATGNRIAGASARLRAARANAARSATTMAIADIEAWHKLFGAQALLDLSEALVIRHRTILDDTRARITAGLASAADAARAEARLADAMAGAARQARSLAAVRARTRELFGTSAPAHPLRPPPPQSTAVSADAAAGLSHEAPGVAAAQALAESARALARAARADTRPRLSAGISGSRYNAFQRDGSYDVRGQFVLRQSLSLGGAEAARRAEADARATGAGFTVDRIIAESERDAQAAFADARILDGSLDVLDTAYRANRRARDAMAEQFRLSRGSLVDLLRAEQEYFAAAAALIQGSVDRDIARYTLLASTGELLPLLAIPLEPNPKG
jgi:adhesin transport system outer membrane protein